MKILVAPLNWGLGHASRCVPLVRRFLDEGHEVILGGDGESLTLLRRHFPKLRYVYLAPLTLRYGSGKRQVGAMLRALPKLISWAIKDHAMLQAVLREEKIDRVISDNRFGLYSDQCECIYMTHQLHIMLPKGWKWAEPIAERLHARIYRRFDKVWVPDFEDKSRSLSGDLGHPANRNPKVEYIGPLSRLSIGNGSGTDRDCIKNESVVAVLSGLEPQRTIFEKEIIARYQGTDEKVLIVQGLMNRPNTRFKRGNITIVPYLGDEELVKAMCHAKRIIARSGYSTIMDLAALGMIDKAALIPTPGQPEQEYLAFLLCKN
jgi:UDP:flavonoid glycosyltransferase YjiC (YdhE family)